MSEVVNKTGSRSARLDLDWSQVRETVMMLNLAVAQIEVSMRDGEDSVNDLTETFTSMVGSVRSIEVATEALPDSGETVSIREELAMFEAILAGATVEEAMALAAVTGKEGAEQEIELF